MVAGSLTVSQQSKTRRIEHSFTHSEGILIEPSVPKMVRKSSPVTGKAGMSPVPASQDRCEAAVLPKTRNQTFRQQRVLKSRYTYSVKRNDPTTPEENFIVTWTVESTGYGLSFGPWIA